MFLRDCPLKRSALRCITLFLVLLIFSFGAAEAAQVSMAWDKNPEPQVTGYKLYVGNTSRSYQSSVDVGNTTSYTFTGIQPGKTTYLALTAYDGSKQEGPYSDEIVCNTIVSSSGSNGAISPSGTIVLGNGSSRTFTITPASGYLVSDVLIDGTSVGPVTSYTFSNVTASHTISASFAPVNRTYTITASAGANGTISPSGSVSVTQGGGQAFSITPNSGYAVSDVFVDGSSVGPVTSYSFSNVTANHTISASFAALPKYTLTASAGPNGSISPSGSVSVVKGSNQTFFISPASGYSISDVLVDGSSVGPVTSYTFSNITTNHTISVSFAAARSTITASAGPNGSISPSGSVSVNRGASQTFTITPNQNYHISDVAIDGSSIGPVTTYTFSNVTTAHTIVASFAQNTQLTAAAGPDQRVTESAKVQLNGSNSHGSSPIASYLWTQTSGPSVVLSNSKTASPTFTAPQVGPNGAALVFKLTLTDKSGLQASDDCVVNVTWNNMPPLADAGPDQKVAPLAAVVLNGSNSTDPDDGIASYLWEQTAGPSVTLSNAKTARAGFVAPSVGFEGKTLLFRLTVTDQGGLKSTSMCVVNVTSGNVPPAADAGPNQTIHAMDTAMLDGSNSRDSDGSIVSYQWIQTSGPPVTLSDPSSVQPSFVGPETAGATLGFTLIVTDGDGLSSTARCTVYVQGSATPDLTGAWGDFKYASGTVSGTFNVQNTGSFDCSFPGAPARNTGRIVVSAGGTNVQLYQPALALEPNMEYMLSFSAYSNTAHAMTVSLMKHTSPYTSYGLSNSQVKLSSNWNVYQLRFRTANFSAPVTDGRLMFSLANTAVSGDQYFIDDVVLAKVSTPAVNVVKNPSFEAGTNQWTFYTNGAGSFDTPANGAPSRNAGHIRLAGTGSNMQLYQANLQLDPGTDYQLTFSAYSSVGHGMTVSLVKNVSPYTNYGLSNSQIKLTAGWNTYQVKLRTANFTSKVSDGRLMFSFVGSAVAGDQYWIDNVVLSKVSTPAVNVVQNPGFESGTAPWTFYSNGIGNDAVGQSTLKVYLSADGKATTQLLKTYTVPSMATGAVTGLSSSYSASTLSGKYILVTIDTANDVVERDETNNRVSRLIQ